MKKPFGLVLVLLLLFLIFSSDDDQEKSNPATSPDAALEQLQNPPLIRVSGDIASLVVWSGQEDDFFKSVQTLGQGEKAVSGMTIDRHGPYQFRVVYKDGDNWRVSGFRRPASNEKIRVLEIFRQNDGSIALNPVKADNEPDLLVPSFVKEGFGSQQEAEDWAMSLDPGPQE